MSSRMRAIERSEKMMRLALKEAQLALSEGEIPVGAVVAVGDEVIARAHNERERTKDPTAHAEVLAIRRAAERLGSRRLGQCTLYVTLEPCPMCAGAIVMAQMKALCFGAPDTAAGCTGSVYAITEDPAFSFFVPTYGGILEDECKAIIKQFFSMNRSE